MKGLDTPILLDLLRGRPRAVSLLKTLGDEELCTTEVNLYELEVLARRDRRPGRERRLAALERLRRKLTVLPVDERGARAGAALAAASGQRGARGVDYLVAGVAASAGVAEWVTIGDLALPKGPGRLRIRPYPKKHS